MSSDYLRVFVGGLSQTITEKDLQERFGKYGKVFEVTIKSKTDPTGEWLKSFGYVNIHISKESFGKCKSQLNNAAWKGGKLSIQLAKMDPVKKVLEAATLQPDPAVNDLQTEKRTPIIPTIMKGAVPGTLLEENDKWVVTKFQRVVPIMKIRSKDKKKLITYNPAKHSHQIKNLDKTNNKNQVQDDDDMLLLDNLTWNIDDTESPRAKVQNSEFTGRSKRRGRSAQELIELEKAKKDKQKLEDDLEVVPTLNPSKTTKLTNGNKTTPTNKSKFDSDTNSESEIEFNMNAKCTPATPWNVNGSERTLTSKTRTMTPKSNGHGATSKTPEAKAINFSSSAESSSEEEQPAARKASTFSTKSPKSQGRPTTYSSSSESNSENEDVLSKKKKRNMSKSVTRQKTENLVKAQSKTVSKKRQAETVSTDSSSSEDVNEQPKSKTARVSKSSNISLNRNTKTARSHSESTSDESSETSNTGTSASRSQQTKMPLSQKQYQTQSQAKKHDSDTSSTTSDSDNEQLVSNQKKKSPNVPSRHSGGSRTKRKRSSGESDSSSSSENETVMKNVPPKKAVNLMKSSSDSSSSDSDSSSDVVNKSNSTVSKSETIASSTSTKQPTTNRINTIENKKKHELSNLQRLEAMKNRQAQLKTQQQLIKSALTNPDSTVNKKKTFDSSDDNSGDEERRGDTARKPSIKTEPSKSTSSKLIKSKPKTGGLALFSDSSSSDEEDLADRFKIKKQFEGEKGAKLLNLQHSYKDDNRFKLTDTFISDSEDGSTSENNEHKSDDANMEVSAADEKKRSLQILQSIVGSKNVRLEPERSNKKRVADTSANVFRDVSSMQFDPTDDKTSHLVQEGNKDDKPAKPKKRKSGVDPVVGIEPAPEISKDKFYEVNISFNKTVADNSDKSSTGLFNFFDEEEKEDEPSDENIEEKTTHTIANKKPASITSGHQFSFFNTGEQSNDSSSDESQPEAHLEITKTTKMTTHHKFNVESSAESEEDNRKINTNRTDEKMDTTSSETARPQVADAPVSGVVDHFFFTLTDPRLKSGRTKFSQTLSDDEIRKRWNKIKQQLVQDYKKKSHKYHLNERRNVHLSRRGDKSEPSQKKQRPSLSKDKNNSRNKKK